MSACGDLFLRVLSRVQLRAYFGVVVVGGMILPTHCMLCLVQVGSFLAVGDMNRTHGA